MRLRRDLFHRIVVFVAAERLENLTLGTTAAFTREQIHSADDLTVQTGKVRVRFFEYLGLSSLAAPKCEPSQL